MLRLQFLTPNAAWVFTFGDSLVQLADQPMFFERRKDAVAAAAAKRIEVTAASKGGWCLEVNETDEESED